MDKKAIAYAAIICGMGWLAYPLIYNLIKKRKKKVKDGSKDEKGGMGKATVKKQDASSRSGKGNGSKLLLGNINEKKELLK